MQPKLLTFFDRNRYTNSLTVLAVACIDSIVDYSILIQLVITNFELNIKEPTHSANQGDIFNQKKALIDVF
jgi:hypothetical protein